MSEHSHSSESSTLSLVLPQQQLGRLQALARIKNLQAHELIEHAVAQYLDMQEKHHAFIFSLHQVTADFEATGQHMPLDVFDAWVKTIQTRPNEPLPPCQS